MKYAVSLFCLVVVIGTSSPLRAQPSVFTYQGRLWDSGQPADGFYDLQFRLTDALAGGNYLGPALTNAPVAVSNGLFTVALDFGAAVFDGSPRWLEIGVRTNGSPDDYTLLYQRQQLTAAPFALFARSAQFATSLAAGSSFSGNGAGLTNLSGSGLQAATVPAGALVDYSLSSTNLSDAVFIPLLAGNLDAATNINRFGWTHFSGKLRGNAPVRILIVGNGFTYPPFNILDFFVPRLEAAGGLPENGRLIQQVSSVANCQMGYGYDHVWYNGDAVVLTNETSAADYTMASVNVRGVYYVVTNFGGTFKLQSFTAGNWQDISDPISTYSASASYVTNCLLTNQTGLTSDRLRAQNLSGSNIILCATSFNTLTNGVVWGKYAMGSSSPLNVMAPPISYLAPLFTNWAPDLILVKEDYPGTNYLSAFEGFSQFMKTNCPNADIVWCGLHPNGLRGAGSGLYPGNIQMEIAIRQLCVKYNMAYFDAWTALGGQQVWGDRGWDMGDGVHPSAAGIAAYDALLWAWFAPFRAQ